MKNQTATESPVNIQDEAEAFEIFTHNNTPPEQWKFVTNKTLTEIFEIGERTIKNLRHSLPEGVYWIQPRRKLLWNARIIKDFLVYGDRPEHRALIERYLAEFNPTP